jgi:hypothetical protein
MRRRRQFYMLIAASTALLVNVGVELGFVAKYEPSFYRRTAMAAGPERTQLGESFLKTYTEFLNSMINNQEWQFGFSQDQLNGHLQENEQTRATSLFTFPDGVSEPRVEFNADRLRVGFRYGTGWYAVVVSVDLRTWLVAKEPNVIALELCGVSVGGLPLSSHALMEFVTEAARDQNADVTWYRNGRNPVALIRLQANQSRPTLQLRRFEIQPGKLLINGKPTGDVVMPPEPTAAGQ